MRLLVLLRDHAPNGITTYNRTLVGGLRALGHEVQVWPPQALGADPRQWPLRLLHPGAEPLLRPRVRRLRPDAVVVSHYTTARLASRLRRSLGTPWYACMHNGHPAARLAEWARLFENASGIVTMCETLHRAYAALVARELAGRVPPVLLSRLPLELPAPAPPRTEGPLTLSYCSRLSGKKAPRCEAWLRAIGLLPGCGQYRVQVIGGGSGLRRLREVAAGLGLAVHFTGMVPDPGPWLEQTDVLAGAGYALMEGLVRGCSGVGLGFGGCVGAITPQRFEHALALNFGDHCPRRLPDQPEDVAQALAEAIAPARGPAAAQVAVLCRQRFEPRAVAAEVASFIERTRTG